MPWVGNRPMASNMNLSSNKLISNLPFDCSQTCAITNRFFVEVGIQNLGHVAAHVAIFSEWYSIFGAKIQRSVGAAEWWPSWVAQVCAEYISHYMCEIRPFSFFLFFSFAHLNVEYTHNIQKLHILLQLHTIYKNYISCCNLMFFLIYVFPGVPVLAVRVFRHLYFPLAWLRVKCKMSSGLIKHYLMITKKIFLVKFEILSNCTDIQGIKYEPKLTIWN